MQNLIIQAVNVGMSLWNPINAITAVPGFASAAKEGSYQINNLISEIEQAKVFLQKIKKLIDASLKQELAICNLFSLIDSVNAFQVFFKQNFMGKTNHGYMLTWPEWYRTELRHGISHVLTSLLMFQQEMDSYSSIIVEEMMKENPPDKNTSVNIIPVIRKKLQQKNSKCAKAAAYWKKQGFYQKGSWDICPGCHVRSGPVRIAGRAVYEPMTKEEQYVSGRGIYTKNKPKQDIQSFGKFLKEASKDVKELKRKN